MIAAADTAYHEQPRAGAAPPSERESDPRTRPIPRPPSPHLSMLPFPWSRAHASINHNINTIIILPPGTKDYAKASKAPRRPACSARRGLAVHGDWRGAPAAVSIGEGGEGSRLTSRNEPRARPRPTAWPQQRSIVNS